MRLTPKELNRLTIFTIAELARRRMARGRKLNAPESIAVICDEIFELAWDGLPLDEVISRAREVLSRDDVMDGVPEIIGNIEMDALFPSGSTLVVVEHPLGPPLDERGQAPGGTTPGSEPVTINPGRVAVELDVENLSTLPIEVSSHFHFFEANRQLIFDRRMALGMRLDIPAGSALRWGSTERRQVNLIPLTGAREIWGFDGLIDGPVDATEATQLLNEAIEQGFAHKDQENAS